MSTSSLSTQSTIIIPREEEDTKDDLVERDANGKYIIMAPAANINPNMLKNQAELMADRENEIIAMYGKGDAKSNPEVMQQIKVALANSQKRAIQSLEQDKWMFERDPKTKF